MLLLSYNESSVQPQKLGNVNKQKEKVLFTIENAQGFKMGNNEEVDFFRFKSRADRQTRELVGMWKVVAATPISLSPPDLVALCQKE